MRRSAISWKLIVQTEAWRFALLLSLMCLAMATAGEPVPLGVRGLYGDAYATAKADTTRLQLRHPAVAILWGDEYLAPFGLSAETGKVLPSSGLYTSPTPVSWLFTPESLAVQMGYKDDGGLQINDLAYDAATGQVAFDLTLYRKGVLLAGVTASVRATEAEYQTLRRLQEELRLRLRLDGTVTSVAGKSIADGVNLHCVIETATLHASDLGVEVLATRPAQCSERGARSVHERALEAIGESDSDEVMLDEDPVADEAPAGITLAVSTARGLPYAEGMQPFRQGWYLRDPFPPHKYDPKPSATGVIAICEHSSLPATLVLPLEKPLPAGTYRVALSRIYLRAREFDTILTIRMGDDSVETAYYFGGNSRWIVAPALRTREATSEVRITITQIGIGGRGEAPPYFRRFFATEFIRIMGGPQ